MAFQRKIFPFRSLGCSVGVTIFFLCVSACSAPFDWSVSSGSEKHQVQVIIEADAYLSQATTSVTLTDVSGKALDAVAPPMSVAYTADGNTEQIFPTGKHTWEFATEKMQPPFTAQIEYQGCVKGVCLLPRSLTLSSEKTDVTLAPTTNTAPQNDTLLSGWQVKSKLLGLAEVSPFLDFLRGKSGQTALEDSTPSQMPTSGLLLLLIAFVAGMGLNLTPCVLPLVPINLAIIGVTAGSSRRTGILLGGAFGLGMALAYGTLGLFSVLAGTKFGALNSSPIFNFIVAVIMCALALSLFGFFSLDFSSLQAKIDPTKFRIGKFLTALVLGIFAALLAGACVAPVLVAVLLWSSTLYAAGNMAGLALPFVVGIGMGLPYVLLGAGIIAALPRPGAWMRYVEKGFGVVLVVIALSFVVEGIRLMAPYYETVEFARLEAALTEARATGRPVLIDFWATWCKNCKDMDKTTLANYQVKKDIAEKFVFVKFQAEHPTKGRTAALLDKFSIPGLPAFVILETTRKSEKP